MFREITTHRGNLLNDKLIVNADMNMIGAGGACCEYVIEKHNIGVSRIKFQNGPVVEAGVNGWSNEVLLAILQDRLEGFQTGPFNDGYNDEALLHVRGAMAVLKARTAERQDRGVEGKHVR